MEAVPDEVELVHVAAHGDQRQHQHAGDLLTELDAAGEEENSEKGHSQHPAGEIGKPLLHCRRRIGDKVCEDVSPLLIPGPCCGEGVVCAVGQLQAVISRQQHKGAKADADD